MSIDIKLDELKGLEEPHVVAVEANFAGAEEVRDRLLTTEVAKLQIKRLAMKGLNATEAAKVVGLSPATVREYYKDPAFRRDVRARVDKAFEGIDEAFAEKRKTLHEMLEEQAYKSCEDLISMLNDQEMPLHPSLKVKIHQDFMNRVEDSKPLQGVMRIEPQDLRHAANVAAEMDNVIMMKKKA